MTLCTLCSLKRQTIYKLLLARDVKFKPEPNKAQSDRAWLVPLHLKPRPESAPSHTLRETFSTTLLVCLAVPGWVKQFIWLLLVCFWGWLIEKSVHPFCSPVILPVLKFLLQLLLLTEMQNTELHKQQGKISCNLSINPTRISQLRQGHNSPTH